MLCTNEVERKEERERVYVFVLYFVFLPSTWEQRLRLSIFFFANSLKSHHGYAIIAQCCCDGTNEGQWNEAIAEWREG